MTTATDSSTGDAGLIIVGLDVVYSNAVVALSGVSLAVPPGAFVAVLGANGAGKTTLVRAVTGLLPLHDGRIRDGTIHLDGQLISGQSAGAIVRRGICQVPEGRMLFPRLTVEHNLQCGAATRSDSREAAKTLEQVWELFPVLSDRRGQRAGFLSGGEQQMVAIGRALMADPKLLICDELSLGLAPMLVKELFGLLGRLNRERGMAVLVIEQNARLALDAASYGYVLETGRVMTEGPAADLRADKHIQEHYLGGAGEVKDVYEAVVRRYSQRLRSRS